MNLEGKLQSGKKVLLIGKAEEVFRDKAFIPAHAFDSVMDISAIEKIQKRDKYQFVCMQFKKPLKKLKEDAEMLKELFEKAKFFLFTLMHEEKYAVSLAKGENKVFDDYMIYPMDGWDFYETLFTPKLFGMDFEEKNQSEKIRHLVKLATEDELTGLKNRRYIMEFARQILEYARIEGGRVTLLLFDIDDFKDYNDIYGHAAGDEILKEASIVMKRCCRATDVVGRIGGDEFVVLFWDDLKKKAESGEDRRAKASDHPHEAIFIANRFRNEINKSELQALGKQGRGVLSISGGLACYPRDASDVEELFQKADEALYDAKRSGKNRIYLVGSPEKDISKIK